MSDVNTQSKILSVSDLLKSEIAANQDALREIRKDIIATASDLNRQRDEERKLEWEVARRQKALEALAVTRG